MLTSGRALGGCDAMQNGYQGDVCEDRKSSQVENQLASIEKDIAVQNEVIDLLYSKLSPITMPQLNGADKGSPVPSLVPLAETLRRFSGDVYGNNIRLRSLLDSIEL
jgi:hypothetical protein